MGYQSALDGWSDSCDFGPKIQASPLWITLWIINCFPKYIHILELSVEQYFRQKVKLWYWHKRWRLSNWNRDTISGSQSFGRRGRNWTLESKKDSISTNDICRLDGFFEWSEKELKIFFTRSCQLSQIVSYLAGIMDDDGNIALNYLKTLENKDNTIIQILVRSRHINSKMYKYHIDNTRNSSQLRNSSLRLWLREW